MSVKIYPLCKGETPQHYVSAEGYVMPCCWLGNKPFIDSYLEIFKDCLPEMSVLNRPIKDITSDPRFKRIEQTWETSAPLSACTKICNKKIENEKERHGLDVKKEVFKNHPS